MLRLIHSFDVKPGIEVESFVEWLDHELWVRSEPFGCTERFLADGAAGTQHRATDPATSHGGLRLQACELSRSR